MIGSILVTLGLLGLFWKATAKINSLGYARTIVLFLTARCRSLSFLWTRWNEHLSHTRPVRFFRLFVSISHKPILKSSRIIVNITLAFLLLSTLGCSTMTPNQARGLYAAAQLYQNMEYQNRLNQQRVVREHNQGIERSTRNIQVQRQLYSPKQQNPVNPYQDMSQW